MTINAFVWLPKINVCEKLVFLKHIKIDNKNNLLDFLWGALLKHGVSGGVYKSAVSKNDLNRILKSLFSFFNEGDFSAKRPSFEYM